MFYWKILCFLSSKNFWGRFYINLFISFIEKFNEKSKKPNKNLWHSRNSFRTATNFIWGRIKLLSHFWTRNFTVKTIWFPEILMGSFTVKISLNFQINSPVKFFKIPRRMQLFDSLNMPKHQCNRINWKLMIHCACVFVFCEILVRKGSFALFVHYFIKI